MNTCLPITSRIAALHHTPGCRVQTAGAVVELNLKSSPAVASVAAWPAFTGPRGTRSGGSERVYKA